MRHSLLALVCIISFSTRLIGLEHPPLPANTTWLLSLDVRQALSGPCADLARQCIDSATAAPGVKNWLTMTNIDPLTDIDQIMASGTDFTPLTSSLIVSGRFDAKRLIALAEAAQGHQAILHGNYVIHRWIDPAANNREVFAALVDGHLLFAPTRNSAIHSLDAFSANAAVAEPVAMVDRFTGPLIAAAAANDLAHMPHLDQSAAMLRQISHIAANLQTEGDHIVSTVIATTTDEATATQLQQIGQGLLALALFNKDTPADAKVLLSGIRISQANNQVTVQTTLPIATLRAVMAKGANR